MNRRVILQTGVIGASLVVLPRIVQASKTMRVHGLLRRFDVRDSAGDMYTADGIDLRFATDLTVDFNPRNVVGKVTGLVLRRGLSHSRGKTVYVPELLVEADLDKRISLEGQMEQGGPLYWALSCRACGGEGSGHGPTWYDLDHLKVAVTTDPLDPELQGMVWPV